MIDDSSIEVNQPVVTNETLVGNLIILDLNRDNKGELTGLRKEIDGVDDIKLLGEVEKYGDCLAGRKAFIAVIGFKPAGYVEVKLQENPPDNLETSQAITAFAHLARIGVIPEFRGKGVATDLIDSAEVWAQS
jgi:GNAT superfamily N-acetyltransferase